MNQHFRAEMPLGAVLCAWDDKKSRRKLEKPHVMPSLRTRKTVRRMKTSGEAVASESHQLADINIAHNRTLLLEIGL